WWLENDCPLAWLSGGEKDQQYLQFLLARRCQISHRFCKLKWNRMNSHRPGMNGPPPSYHQIISPSLNGDPSLFSSSLSCGRRSHWKRGYSMLFHVLANPIEKVIDSDMLWDKKETTAKPLHHADRSFFSHFKHDSTNGAIMVAIYDEGERERPLFSSSPLQRRDGQQTSSFFHFGLFVDRPSSLQRLIDDIADILVHQ
ncbi:hypothetical protein TrispH2_007585, partial [Trichoplax sp. H2]